MHTLVTAFFSLLALGWIIQGTRAWRGMARLPRLSKTLPATGDSLPHISIVFAARDEAQKLPAALQSLVELDYPDYEIIAVNDRSRDATPDILDEFAEEYPNLKVIHVAELPSGWLGKPHALERGSEAATGEWIVFTDADVRFEASVLRRAWTLVSRENWDHLTFLAAVDLHGFWETTTVAYLGLGFTIALQPWRVSDPQSGSYFGVGAFQMVRRSAYEAIGRHKKLAMEIVDDVKLGKLMKLNRFRSGIASSETFVQVRWQDGFRNLVHGVTKNLFAGLRFSIFSALVTVVGVFVISILPVIGLFATRGLAQAACAISVLMSSALSGNFIREVRKSRVYGLSHVVGAAVFIYMVLRSTIVTLWRGGVVWRDTFYPIAELRKGIV